MAKPKLDYEAIIDLKHKLKAAGQKASGATANALLNRTLACLRAFPKGLTVKEMLDHFDIGCPRKCVSELRLKGYPINDFWEIQQDSFGNERRFKRYFYGRTAGGDHHANHR